MPRKSKEEAEKTRQSIINSALKMFYNNGYAKTSLNGISKKLGLSKGAVYWHFNSKLDLFNAISKKISEKITNEIKPIAEKVNEIEDLKHFFVKFAEYIHRDPETRKYITALFYRIEWDDEMLDRISFVKDQTLKDFCEHHISKWQKKKLIICDIKAEDAAKVLVSGFNGCILTNILNPDFVAIVKTSVDIFFKGIENRE